MYLSLPGICRAKKTGIFILETLTIMTVEFEIIENLVKTIFRILGAPKIF